MRRLVTLAALTLVTALLAPVALAQSLAEVEGKWSLKKTDERWGGEITQALEITKDQFTYRVRNKAGETLLFAKGKLKLEKLGALKVMNLTEIRGGYGDTELQDTNDDRVIVYITGWNTLTLARNFDQLREGEDAVAETYKKEAK